MQANKQLKKTGSLAVKASKVEVNREMIRKKVMATMTTPKMMMRKRM